MADNTTIKTKFYLDEYIQSLPPTDKLLFKYLLDGPQVEPTLGIYELSLPTMAFHTGLERENILHSLNRFAQAGKIHHVDGWIIVKNHFRHNPLRGNSRLVTGALNRLEQVPFNIRERLSIATDTLYIPYLDPMHSLYIALEPVPFPSQSHSRPSPSPKPRGDTRPSASPDRRENRDSAPKVLEIQPGRPDPELEEYLKNRKRGARS